MGRHQIKIIASEDYIDLHPFLKAPLTGLSQQSRSKTRGAKTELFELLESAFFGAKLKRAQNRDVRKAYAKTWATQKIMIEVARK